jgi:hypothetical protein
MVFSAPVQTGPGAHPATYAMGTGSFPGLKRLGRGVNHPPQSLTEVKEGVELWAFVACSRENFTFFNKRWAGPVACGRKSSTYRILVRKPEGKRPLGTLSRRLNDNIKMYLQNIRWEGVDWIDPV